VRELSESRAEQKKSFRKKESWRRNGEQLAEKSLIDLKTSSWEEPLRKGKGFLKKRLAIRRGGTGGGPSPEYS